MSHGPRRGVRVGTEEEATMALSAERDERTEASGGLRQELKLTDAAAFSAGLIGPVGAMALLGVGAVPILGRAVTWAFVFALVGVSLVAYAFIRLSRHISHTGSVYALVGTTLGPQAGFFAGWALLGAYAGIAVGSGIEIALFFAQFLGGVGILHTSEWIVIALIALVVIGALAFAEIKIITRTLLFSELIGVVLVSILSVVVIVTLIAGSAPHHRGFSWQFLAFPHGTGFSTISKAALYGFLAFAGFEGAAALGEETLNPKREIPRAIKVALTVVGVFYILTIVAQSIGFGPSKAGVAAFSASQSPYADLARMYVDRALADVLNLAASISLFAICLGTSAGAARILYALARDATGGRNGLAGVSRRGAPIAALAVILLVVLGGMVGQRLAGVAVENATFYALQLGTLCILVAYLMATLGAIKFLFFDGRVRTPIWQIVIPALGAAFVGYTLYKNIVGQSFPYDRFPYVVGAYLLIGLAIVAFTPGLAGRVRRALATGFAADPVGAP
jgi:amino acid transporter